MKKLSIQHNNPVNKANPHEDMSYEDMEYLNTCKYNIITLETRLTLSRS
jgi:hypothetical protein